MTDIPKEAVEAARDAIENIPAPGYYTGIGPETVGRLRTLPVSPTLIDRIALAALTAALPHLKPAPQWQPIESAPKDGTLVDLWCHAPGPSAGGARVTDCWHSMGHWWRYDEQYGDDQCRSPVHHITHWQPLPTPPGDAT